MPEKSLIGLLFQRSLSKDAKFFPLFSTPNSASKETQQQPPVLRLPLVKMASSADQKLMKATKFPPEFDKKVDTTKVNLDVIKKCVLYLLQCCCICLHSSSDTLHLVGSRRNSANCYPRMKSSLVTSTICSNLDL